MLRIELGLERQKGAIKSDAHNQAGFGFRRGVQGLPCPCLPATGGQSKL